MLRKQTAKVIAQAPRLRAAGERRGKQGGDDTDVVHVGGEVEHQVGRRPGGDVNAERQMPKEVERHIQDADGEGDGAHE
jgi:hypothetical protein